MYVVDCLELSASECVNLGMLPGLTCHSCNDLDKFQLSSLKADCQRCCEADKDGDKPQRVNSFFFFFFFFPCFKLTIPYQLTFFFFFLGFLFNYVWPIACRCLQDMFFNY